MTCGVFEPCFAADDFVVEPDVRSCRERELYVAVHIVLRLLLGDLDGRATHSEMARDFLEVRLFGVLISIHALREEGDSTATMPRRTRTGTAARVFLYAFP